MHQREATISQTKTWAWLQASHVTSRLITFLEVAISICQLIRSCDQVKFTFWATTFLQEETPAAYVADDDCPSGIVAFKRELC